MSQDQHAPASPFAALSYQEQQDRWMEWRSRQLDYRDAEPSIEERRREGRQQPSAAMRQPVLRDPAPTRHQELDQVLARHKQALRRAGAFQATSIDETKP